MIHVTVYRIVSVIILTVKAAGFAVGEQKIYLQEQEVKTAAEMNCCPVETNKQKKEPLRGLSLCASSCGPVINDLPHKSHQCIMREQEPLERHECDGYLLKMRRQLWAHRQARLGRHE